MRATVLIPTHDHGPTLTYSVRSALAQTVEDIEVFVIGDGVPDETRELVAALQRDDARLRFVDHEKSPRQGEPYRHAVLAEARGEVVCYLSDDDLWLPDHVEAMAELLRAADFAHALPIRIDRDGTIGGWAIDLRDPWFREQMLAGRNWIPLSCGAHTLRAYRRLPEGWTTTPAGTPTDLYLWQKFLRLTDAAFASGWRPTVLHFPSPDRGHLSLDERVEELARWQRRIVSPEGRQQLEREVVAYLVRDRARLEALSLAQQSLLDAINRTRTWRLRNWAAACGRRLR